MIDLAQLVLAEQSRKPLRRISGDGRDQRATTDTVIVGIPDSEVLLDGRD
jgi:hypothetical protein